jgi:hypothetical protein
MTVCAFPSGCVSKGNISRNVHRDYVTWKHYLKFRLLTSPDSVDATGDLWPICHTFIRLTHFFFPLLKLCVTALLSSPLQLRVWNRALAV